MVKTSPSNTRGCAGSIPGRGAKIPRASQPKNQNIEQKQYCNKFNNGFKNGPHQNNLEKKKIHKSDMHEFFINCNFYCDNCICKLLRLTFFTEYNSFEIHPSCVYQ